MTVLDRLAGALLAAAALAAMAFASNASIGAHRSADGMLRVAWSAMPEWVETCREASAEELARLPPHMRQRLVCEGTTASYRLTVRAGGALLADRVVRAGGLRHDRRLYVFQEFRIPAGETGIDVRFDRVEGGGGPGVGPGAAPPAQPEFRRVQKDSVAPRLAWTERVAFTTRSVVLVTYDARRRALFAVRPAGVTPRPEPRR